MTKGKESKLLDKLLECFQAKKLLKSGGKQRVDSTHILAKVRHLSRLESVVETLHAALNELAEFFPEWLQEQVTSRCYELYSRRIEEYRLPKGEASRQEYIDEVGKHGFALLKAIAASDSEKLKNLPMVKLLEQMWEQQLEIKDGKVCFLAAEKLAPVGERFDSPYDAEAKCGKKRSMNWQGYKVHLTETCGQESPHPITNVITTAAFLPDTEVNFKIDADLKEKGLSPDIHLVDAGYPENEWVLKEQCAQSVRGYGLRQTGYIGKAKTHLHNIAIASAVSIVRSVAWLDGKPLEKTRVSRFAGLAATNH